MPIDTIDDEARAQKVRQTLDELRTLLSGNPQLRRRTLEWLRGELPGPPLDSPGRPGVARA